MRTYSHLRTVLVHNLCLVTFRLESVFVLVLLPVEVLEGAKGTTVTRNPQHPRSMMLHKSTCKCNSACSVHVTAIPVSKTHSTGNTEQLMTCTAQQAVRCTTQLTQESLKFSGQPLCHVSNLTQRCLFEGSVLLVCQCGVTVVTRIRRMEPYRHPCHIVARVFHEWRLRELFWLRLRRNSWSSSSRALIRSPSLSSMLWSSSESGVGGCLVGCLQHGV